MRLGTVSSILSCLLLAAVATSCSERPAGDEASAAMTQADAPSAQQAPQQLAAEATVTAFPSASDPCHRIEEDEYLGESWPYIPGCTKVLMEKYGDFIRYTTQPPTLHGTGDASGKAAKDYLTIRAGNGSAVTYRYMSLEAAGDGDDDYAFDPVPIAVYEPLRLLLVRVVSYGEEVTYDLINLDTGKKTELGSVELPLAFSPDNRRFFVLDTEFGAELPLSLSIYGMDAGVVGREAVVENPAWSPFDARWDGADRIAFTGATDDNMHWDGGRGTSTGPRLSYALEDGKWRPVPAPAGRR